MSLLLASEGGAVATIVVEDDWRPVAVVAAAVVASAPAYSDDALAPAWLADDARAPQVVVATSPVCSVAFAADEIATPPAATIIEDTDVPLSYVAKSEPVLREWVDDSLPIAPVATIVSDEEWRAPYVASAAAFVSLVATADELAPTWLADDSAVPRLIVEPTIPRWLPATDEQVAPTWLAEEQWTVALALTSPPIAPAYVDEESPTRVVVDEAGPTLWWAPERVYIATQLDLDDSVCVVIAEVNNPSANIRNITVVSARVLTDTYSATCDAPAISGQASEVLQSSTVTERPVIGAVIREIT